MARADTGTAESLDAGSVLYELDLPTELIRMREAIRARFKPLVDHTGVSYQYWRVLKALAEMGAVEVTQLSRIAVIPPASLSRLLPRMEREGLIRRTWRARDRRRIIVDLTQEGRDRQAEVEGIIRRGLSELARQMDPNVLVELGRCLDIANAAIEKVPLLTLKQAERTL